VELINGLAAARCVRGHILTAAKCVHYAPSSRESVGESLAVLFEPPVTALVTLESAHGLGHLDKGLMAFLDPAAYARTSRNAVRSGRSP
jgi:hypothetical protein